MSKINNLIKQYCPDGVEFKTLEELGKFYTGLSGKTKKDFENGNCKYVTYKNIYNNPALDTDIEDKVFIKLEEKQNAIKYGDILFTASSETPDECGFSSVVTTPINETIYLNSFCFGYRLNNNNLFLPDFLKHFFRNDETRKAIGKTANGVTRFNISKEKFSKIKIPLPPLIIQQEIVGILDKFLELQKELQKELELRQMQYEYYRNKLLTFTPTSKGVRWMTLGECCEISSGGDLPKEYIKGKSPKKDMIYPIYSNGKEEAALYGFTNNYKIDKKAVTVSARGTIGYHTIRPAYYTPIVRLITLIPNKQLTVDYLNYVLDIVNIVDNCKGTGSIPQLTVPNIKSVIIPVPPLPEQERIVGILDKFETLVNDLEYGIPAEIKLRQQQYEYYRNKLLNFKQAA